MAEEQEMVVAMSLATFLVFGQIVLALVLLYICGVVLYHLRQAQRPTRISSPERLSARSLPRRDAL